MEIDLHIHSRFSPDSRSRPERIVARAKEVGLGAVAVTDHDSLEGARAARRVDESNLIVIPGEELKTDKGDLLALFIEEEIRARTYASIVDQVRSIGGITIVPHPAVSSKLTKDDMRIADGIEVFNATLRAVDNATSRKYAEDLELPGFGSSDAHLVEEIGNGRTRVPDSADLEELRKNMFKGPIVSRAERSNMFVHRANEAMMFGLKGIWTRL